MISVIIMAKYICVVIILFISLVNNVSGQANACTGSALGEDPDGKDIIGVPTDTYFLACAKTYVSGCCARVDDWRVTVDTKDLPVDLMVWRPEGGNNYKLLSSITVTPTNTGKTTHATNQNVIIKPNDCLGWHSGGAELINHKNNNGNGIQAVYIAGMTAPTIGGTSDWSAAVAETNSDSEWGIEARLVDTNSPTYGSGVSNHPISETTSSGAIKTIYFNDTDFSDELTITMSSSPYFSFVDNGDGTGDVSVSASVQPINGQTVTLTFTATDLCSNTATGTITVTVVNTPPNLLNVVIGSNITESITAETRISTFICNDSSGSVNTPVLTVAPSQAPLPSFFHVSYVSGDVYGIYARSQSNAANGVFNYTAQRSYVLTITCSDGFTADDQTQTTTVNVLQNSPPVITNLPPGTTVAANQNVTTGTVIFNITSTDAEGDQVFFNFTCDQNPCPFQVLDSGQVQATIDLRDAAHTGYDIFVDIKDAKNSGTQQTLTVTISGINDTPAFTNMPNTVSVNENVAIGLSIFKVNFTDSNVNDTHTFSMTNTVGGNALFAIDTSTGVITTIAALDYETLTPKVYLFDVVLTDGIAPVTSTVTVSVQDVNEPLVWNSFTYRIDVVERTASGIVLPDPGFAVTEHDTSDTRSCYMDCGTQSGYYIMSTSCVITVQAVYTLDTGSSNTMVCTVTAVDQGPFTSTSTLTFSISDSNDFSPTFNATNYAFSVSTYSSVFTAIGTVAATDADIGTNGSFSYSLDQSGLNDTYFQIDPNTGAITTRLTMSACNCSGTTLTIPVIATDTGGLKSTATVYIGVGDTTTTPASATTTDWYLTFWDDERNLVWFSLCIALLAVTVAFGIFICLKYVCMWKGTCWRSSSMKKWRPRNDDFDDRKMVRRKNPDLVQCRRAPPPAENHAWKQSMRGRGPYF